VHPWAISWAPDGTKLGLASRRAFIGGSQPLILVNALTKASHPVVSLAQATVDYQLSISSNNRTIYFSSTPNDADIWLMSIK
jgi:hypothetical protein